MVDITNTRAINTPQRSYQWEVSINGLSTGSNSDITLRAKTVSIPASQVDTVAIRFKAGQNFYGGRDASGHTVTITFWDDENQTVRSYFQNWFDLLMFNPVTGGQAPKNLYTAQVTLRLFDSTGNTSTAKIVLGNAFVSEIGDTSLTYDSSEPVEISVTLMFDTKVITAGNN